MQKRQNGYFLVCLLIMLLFLSCNKKQEGMAVSNVMPTGPVNIRMIWWGGDTRHKATLEMIDCFSKNIMPNVKIEAEYMGFDGYYQKLTAGLMAGTAPDIIQNNVRFIKSLSAVGDFFVDLEKQDILDISVFDPAFLNNQGRQPDGKLIGVPTGMNAWIMLVSTDFMRKYGINYNKRWSWDDLFEAQKKIRTIDKDKYLMWAATGVQYEIFCTYVSQITGKNWAYDDYSPGFTLEALEAGFELIKRMNDEGVLVPLSISKMSIGSEDDGIRKGICGLFIVSASQISLYYETMDCDVVMMPVLPDAKQSAIGIESSQIMSIPLSSKYPQVAERFIQFMLNEKEGVEIGGVQRGTPASSDATKILEEVGMLHPLMVKAMNMAIENAGNPISGLDLDSRNADLRQRYVEAIQAGSMTPKAAAAELYTQAIELLREMKADAGE